MTGPEHYQAAEQLLDMASAADSGEPAESYYVAATQAHATLAMAAATALGAVNARTNGQATPAQREWAAAI